jgi:hypothetical protein
VDALWTEFGGAGILAWLGAIALWALPLTVVFHSVRNKAARAKLAAEFHREPVGLLLALTALAGWLAFSAWLAVGERFPALAWGAVVAVGGLVGMGIREKLKA